MKRLNQLVICLLISYLSSCSASNSLGDNFEVSYVDIESNKNVYYNNQGIFNSLHINLVYYNEHKILVRGYSEHLNSTMDTNRYEYYIIDKKTYAIDPSQMQSKGLVGPIGMGQFETEKDILMNAKSLSW